MLKTFRDNLKRLAWVLWAVIIAFILIEFSIFSQNQTPGASSQQAAATVGSEEITFREFQRAYNALESQYRASLGENYTPELARQLGLPRQAIDTLIRDRLLLAEARRLGLRVSEEEVREQILEYEVFQENGGFVGAERYRQILSANNLSPAEFEEQVRESLMLEKLSRVLSDSIWISDPAVEAAAREEAERARIRYVRLRASEIADQVEVTPADVEAWFAEHREDYRLPERRRVGYLDVNINQIRAGLEIPEVDLRAYYEANPSEFEQPARVRARHILLFVDDDTSAEEARAELEAIRARVEAGEDFAAIAREVSEDTATRESGGDLGFFGRGEMAPAFEAAAFGAEAPSLVGPVEADFGIRKGYHLIQVLQKEEGGVQPFEEVSNRIRVRLLNERARDRAEERAQEIATAIETRDTVDEAAARQLAQEYDTGFELLEPFAADDNLPGIGRGTPFAQAAFDLEPGQFGEPQRIPTGWAVPIVFEVLEPSLPELAEVREQVRADLVAERQGELAAARLEEARQRIASGESSLDDVAAALDSTVEESNDFGRGASISGLGPAPEVVDAALDLEVGELGGPFEVADGALLFEVVDRQRFDPTTFEENRDDIRQRLANERLNQMLASILEQRRSDLEVSYSRQFVENFELEPSAGT